MWIKKTELEIKQDAIQYQRKRKIHSNLFTIVILFLLIISQRIGWSKYRQPEPESWRQVLVELPISLIISGISGLLFYRFYQTELDKDVICINCDKVKRKDSVLQCSCGETFKDLKLYRWA